MPQPAVPAVLGLVIILNAAITKGAAGAFRWSSTRVHRQLDVVVMVLLVAAAVQPWVSMDNVSRLLLVGVAFVLWFVWFHTDFTEKVPRSKRKATEAAKPSSEAIGRGAGRVVGGGVNSFKRWKDSFGGGADDDA
jgi:Ca2+/Na+ antiporter